MKLKVNKIALSLAAAALMVTSLLSTVTSASATNEITLTADKSSAKAGERINVTVGFVPNDTGAAGFTINLHYDPDKVEVYIPSESEMDSVYNVGSKFSVITNYVSSSGTIRIVGANLMSTNITSSTDLALATFTVKNGASGKINFWTDVETMVSSSGSGYVSSSFSAPTEKSPLTVNGPAAATTDAAAVKTTTSVSSAPETTTTKSASAATTTKSVSDIGSETTTAKPQTVSSAVTSDTASRTTTAAATENPADTTTVPTVTQPGKTASTTSDENEKNDPVYTYETHDIDFNSEEPVSYSFSLSDYITDFSKLYNIKVNISTNGSVNGGIGMLVNGSWQSSDNITHQPGTDIWTADNVDPNSISGDVFVQLYYLKGNSEFAIESIEIVPVNSSDDIVSDSYETDDADSVNETDLSSNSDKDGSGSDSGSIGEDSAVSSETEAPEVSGSDEDTSDADSQAVENAVLHAAQEAEKNSDSSDTDSNPATGAGSHPVRIIIMAVCAAEILWSLFVVIYNRITEKEQN